MIKITEGKLYLITGGSGFLGTPLIRRLLAKNARVRVLSRNEGKLIELQQKFPTIDIYPGDVSTSFDVHQACENVSGIFHLAAFKHVGLAEKFALECVRSNTIGSMNVLQETLGNSQIEFIIGISTDKAAQVSGVYGASKLLMERLFKQYESINHACQYRLVRYGNVLYSTGSVLCKWKDLISRGCPVTVTEPTATRFFWSIEHAIDLIEDCLAKATNSNIYFTNMKAMRIDRLLAAMIQKYSGGKPIEINYIGLQAGENMHEKILEDGQSSNEVEQFTIDEILELI